MTEPFDADAYVNVVAPGFGLNLTPSERAAVSEQLVRIHALAQRVVDFPLAPEDEPAPRFQP